MKKHLVLFTLFVFTALGLSAQSLSQAEANYAKNDFEAAKKQYEQIISSAIGNDKLQAQLRLAACQYHLGEFLNGAKTLYGYQLPTDPVWKARFLLYRIHLAQQVSLGYRRILNEYEIDTPEARADMETWTKAQWNEQIDKDFRLLWALKENLANAPIEAENLILNLKDTDTKRIPTLFDFTVQTWLEFLDNNREEIKPTPITGQTPVFLGGKARLKKGRGEETTRLQAQILQEAATAVATPLRQNAQVFWKTDFILLPFKQAQNFAFDTEEQAASTAVNELNKLSGFTTKESAGWWQRIRAYFDETPANTSYARGYTAWQTAQFLNTHEQAPQALKVCAFADTLPASYFTQQCQNLVEQINRVSLEVSLPGAAVDREKPQINFSGKNLHTVYAKVYTTSFDELKKIYTKNHSKSMLNYWGEIFSSLRAEDFLAFLKQTPLHTSTQSVQYVEPAKSQKGILSLPALNPGIYVILISAGEDFNTKTAPIQGVILNATDLALFATSGIEGDTADFTVLRNAAPKTVQAPIFQLYAVNLKTGEPIGNLPIDLITSWEGSREKAQLQADGTTTLKRAIALQAHNSYHIDALAFHQGSLAYTGALNFSFSHKQPVFLTIQTDRAIYRPGQKVQIAVQAFERQVRGWKTFAAKNLQLTIKDTNWKTVFTDSLPLNEFGTGQTVFTLPQEGLLGDYNIEAKILDSNHHTYHASHSFKVEEFKRPDYEVTLNEPEKALEFGKSGKITGKAAYYFGAPLANAKVNYKLTRKEYIPPFYWWWFRWNPIPNEIVLQGETKTDENGNFTIPFTPTPAVEDDEFAQFVLDAEVFDESGRPIEQSRSYKVSKHPHLFKVDFAQGFYDENKETELAKIDLTDADGKSITGQIHLKAQLLENKLPTVKQQACTSYYCQEKNPSLEEMYKDFLVQKTAFEKTLSFSKPGEQTVRLPALPEGVYRLEISSAKAAPQQLIFVVAAANSKLQLPDVTLAQHSTYYPGETMRILLGNSNLAGSKRIEIYQDNNFLTHKEKRSGGVEIFEFPVTQTMRGGLALRWFGASNYRFYQGNTSVEVPFDNKQLAVKLDLPDTQKPGTQARWKITAADASGSAINGQVSTTVYDKSLDYYAKYAPSLTFNQLFSQRRQLPSSTYSNNGEYTQFLGQPELKRNNSFKYIPLPSLNLEMYVRSYGLGGRKFAARNAMPMMAMAKSADFDGVATEEAAEQSFAAANETMAGGINTMDLKATKAKEIQTDATTIRTDFAETAYFNPVLPMTNGQALLQFVLPQSLTTWNIVGWVLTRNADFGAFTAQTITRKDFMTRLTLPRFYREGDKGTLQAAVTNQTNKKLTAQVTLSITRNNQTVLSAWGIQTPTQTVTVEPNKTQFVTWNVTVPYAPDLYQITAVARSGKDSDGELKELPVLPAKQRLLASAHAALKDGVNTLSLTELANVPQEDVEITSLTLNPSLALSVLNSMPNLLSNPYKDLVSTLNRYVPLAIVHQFYETYPELKEAVKKLPKRAGLTASWDEKNPLRLELLENTPWLRQAKGRQERTADIINLFDDKLVASLLSNELKNITKYQNASGAFTWFAGGPDDEYLTLYALDSFAQALNYRAQIPQASAQKAFKFIYPKIEARLKKDKDGSVGAVAYALYAAYTLSSFPQTWPQYSSAKPYIKRWVDYADEYAKFMTPLGQIYAAAIYHRLGDDVKATRYLDLVLSRMKEDPLTGAYFAPEAQSWVWYNDTLSTQTVTLRTLLEIRPNAPQIEAMTQWLLFNRQVNDWTNTNAAAQAVFTLLEVMKAKGALSAPVKYTVNWAGTQQKISFEPMDWTEDLRWTRTGTQANTQTHTAQITKQGGGLTDFASLNAIYRASDVKASPKGVLNLSRQYFRRVKEGTEIKLIPVANLDNVTVGDEIEVHLTLQTNSAFEYVEVKDPKPAGFESEELLSGWNWNPVSFYKEVRDASTHFFINWLPNGTVTFRYVLRPTVPGQFHAAAAQAQSMYAPQYGAHTASEVMAVTK